MGCLWFHRGGVGAALTGLPLSHPFPLVLLSARFCQSISPISSSLPSGKALPYFPGGPHPVLSLGPLPAVSPTRLPPHLAHGQEVNLPQVQLCNCICGPGISAVSTASPPQPGDDTPSLPATSSPAPSRARLSPFPSLPSTELSASFSIILWCVFKFVLLLFQFQMPQSLQISPFMSRLPHEPPG